MTGQEGPKGGLVPTEQGTLVVHGSRRSRLVLGGAVALVSAMAGALVLGAGGGLTLGSAASTAPAPSRPAAPPEQLTTVAPPPGEGPGVTPFDAPATSAKLEQPALGSALGCRW